VVRDVHERNARRRAARADATPRRQRDSSRPRGGRTARRRAPGTSQAPPARRARCAGRHLAVRCRPVRLRWSPRPDLDPARHRRSSAPRALAAADCIEAPVRAWLAARPNLPQALCEAVRGILRDVITDLHRPATPHSPRRSRRRYPADIDPNHP
jgi:hypothetical protein